MRSGVNRQKNMKKICGIYLELCRIMWKVCGFCENMRSYVENMQNFVKICGIMQKKCGIMWKIWEFCEKHGIMWKYAECYENMWNCAEIMWNCVGKYADLCGLRQKIL